MKLSGPIKLIKESLILFFKKNNLLYFLRIYGILIPFNIFFYFQGNILSGNNVNVTDPTQLLAKNAWTIWASIPVGLAYLIISFWIGASGIKATANVVEGLNLNFGETLKFAWNKLWAFSLLSIVVGLITSIGFILLIVPGILFLVWYHFSSFEFMTKNVGIKAAMGGSKKLVSGKFWPVFGRLIIFGIFGILIQAVLSLIPLSLGNIIQPLFGGLLILPYFLLYRELSNG